MKNIIEEIDVVVFVAFDYYPRNLMVATPRKKSVTEMHPMMV